MELLTIDDTGDISKVCALIYGAPGVGKTGFGLASTTKRVLLGTVEWEQMKLTFKALHSMGKIHPDSKVVPIRTPVEIKEIIEFLTANRNSYDVVVIDHITGIQDILKTALINGRKDSKGLSKDILTLQENQVLIEKTYKIVKELRDIPDIHVFILGQYEETWSDQSTKYVKPSVVGKKLPSKISSALNLVGYMQMSVTGSTIERFITFISGDTVLTKMHPSLRVTEEANMDFILGKVEGEIPVDMEFSTWIGKEPEPKETKENEIENTEIKTEPSRRRRPSR